MTLTELTPLIAAILAFVSYSVRKFAPDGGWLHTAKGAWLIALLSGGLGAIADAVRAGGFHKATIIPALASFLMSFMATANPSLTADGVSKKPDAVDEAVQRKSASGKAHLIVIIVLSAAGFLAACTMMGCAPGTDGLRQACAETDAVLTGVYQVAAATYHAREQALREQVTPATVESIKSKWASNDVIYTKVLAFLDGAKDTKDATCALASAIDAGLKKDLAALIAQVIKIAADVRSAVSELQKLARWHKPSPWRHLAWAVA